MDIVEVNAARRFSPERANRFGLIDRPRLVCELVCLEPGQREPRREQATSDEMYYIVEGQGVMRVGIHEYEIGAGQALVVPPQMEHWLSNPGPDRLTALAFVAPKPGREPEVRGRAERTGPPRGEREREGERRPFRSGARESGFRERGPRPPARERPTGRVRAERAEGPRPARRAAGPPGGRGGPARGRPAEGRGGPARGRPPAGGRREGPSGRGGGPRRPGGPRPGGGPGRGRPPGGRSGGPRRPPPRGPRPSS
jgi:mannose-6-phosphate isomerase-like protein (cupin superfamily)